jgi:hypothetical protein
MPQYGMQQGPGGYYYPMMMMPFQGQAPAMTGGTMQYTNGGEMDSNTQLVQLSSLLSEDAEPTGRTTVMLRNIPLKYNREALLEDMDNRGFACQYDFFYLPIDFHTGNNVGYAFINFNTEETVTRFKQNYNGLQLSQDSAKVCVVNEAKAQGKMKNIEQYRNSSVMNMEDKYQPVVFENGVRTMFPPPTRTLKPVKPRARAT